MLVIIVTDSLFFKTRFFVLFFACFLLDITSLSEVGLPEAIFLSVA